MEIEIRTERIRTSRKESGISWREIAISPAEIGTSGSEIGISSTEIWISPQEIATSEKEIATPFFDPAPTPDPRDAPSLLVLVSPRTEQNDGVAGGDGACFLQFAESEQRGAAFGACVDAL